MSQAEGGKESTLPAMAKSILAPHFHTCRTGRAKFIYTSYAIACVAALMPHFLESHILRLSQFLHPKSLISTEHCPAQATLRIEGVARGVHIKLWWHAGHSRALHRMRARP